MKRSVRGRAAAATVRVQAISLHATNTFDIAGRRRWDTINGVKDALTKGNDAKIEELINAGSLLMRPLAEHQNLIDTELAKQESDESLVNFYRRQQTDGEIVEGDEKYVAIPLETREFFDDAGTRKNPNFGKPMNYADRRRIFLLGRTVSAKEVSDPALMVVEARLDQCYNFEALPWQLIEGFALRVRSANADQILLATTRETEWKNGTVESMSELLKALDVTDIESDQSRCEILLSAPEELQKSINDIYGIYGSADWSKLMNDYDRFTIIAADLMSKSDITIGFRDEFLAEGTTPDDMEFESKVMNFWVPKVLEEQWNKFGNGSRVIFGGQLVDRQIWDAEERKMSEETAPQLTATCFAVIPEYKEEPE
ncbi:hypothetical protein KAR91_87960 [Candidatus Pacearchaeota archaeon]|nr:hypothetical protein [Candidatus Pacearchaeota archaeon]